MTSTIYRRTSFGGGGDRKGRSNKKVKKGVRPGQIIA